MATSLFEKKLKQQIQERLSPATPGVQVQVFQMGKKVCDIELGETFPYYDLASLTKIIFTVQAFMKAFEEKRWDLNSRVQDFCPWFPYENVLIKDCLTHSSGLPWWAPLYQKLDLTTSSLNRWVEGGRIIRGMEVMRSEASVYSDIGFIVLGHVLEAMYSLPLLENWSRLKDDFYSRSTLNFHPENKPPYPIKQYAPTERCSWRNKILQGEVHDDNSWSFGGVAPQAGLFGSVDDVSWYGLLLRSQLRGISKTSIRQKTAQLFSSRARPRGKGDWALGYMMPTPGTASAGSYFSLYSIGHTGFTGTSLWYDPSQDLLVTILSNRVFLGRENKEFASLRPQIHNWVVEGLKRKA
ncbi:MAG: D-alanyl-D-alanine carboxypeptidase [Bdellovibrio sp. CG10_big_fil_rev_8_21_14_0_10_47_8]|nr:MAG: D-alanyl-D-alanine carboxypeptidase [Bdellovibrio sp. CG10_big_fil_rev_8_21_14_0_10_47_8]